MAPSVPKMVVRTAPVITTTGKNSKATTSYTGPKTRAKAKKQAQVQLLETIPENLLSESDDEYNQHNRIDHTISVVILGVACKYR